MNRRRHRELAAKDEVPDLLRLFVPFLDWDKCKAARRELIEVFMNSPAWVPEDFALTAYLCMDLDRIFIQTLQAYGGDNYLNLVESGAGKLEGACRDAVLAAIHRIRS